jgi:hypothetical protein
MKPEELEEKLADAENVLALHGKRITNLEERKTEPQRERKSNCVKLAFQ